MQIESILCLINPQPYKGTIDNLWELRDQVASCEEPLILPTPKLINVLTSIQLALDAIEVLLDTVSVGTVESVKIASAFQGLIPHRLSGVRIRAQAARLFQCSGQADPYGSALHFVGSHLLRALSRGTAIVLEHWDDPALRDALSTTALEEDVKAWLKLLGALPVQRDQVLIGWSHCF